MTCSQPRTSSRSPSFTALFPTKPFTSSRQRKVMSACRPWCPWHYHLVTGRDNRPAWRRPRHPFRARRHCHAPGQRKSSCATALAPRRRSSPDRLHVLRAPLRQRPRNASLLAARPIANDQLARLLPATTRQSSRTTLMRPFPPARSIEALQANPSPAGEIWIDCRILTPVRLVH